MQNRRQFFVGATVVAGAASIQRDVLALPQGSDEPSKVDATLIGQFVAKSHGDMDTIQALIKKEPELVHASWDWGGGDFESGLNAASHVGRRDIAEYLLERGARLDVAAAVMLGMTGVVREMMKVQPKLHEVVGAHNIPMLSHAILGKEPADEVFQSLLSAGANVNAASRIGMTPLMAAASVGRAEQVEVLLAKGANPENKDSKGRRALDIAVKRKHDSVVSILTAAAQ